MALAPHPLEREWVLKWLKGAIEGYSKGKTSLQIVKGRVKTVESYSVSFSDVKQIVDSLLLDPSIGALKQIREESKGADKGYRRF